MPADHYRFVMQIDFSPSDGTTDTVDTTGKI